VDEVEHLAHPGVGDGLINDLLGFDRRDPVREGGAEHDAAFAQRLAADECRQLHHEPGPGIEPGVPERLVEHEAVEDLDQLRVGSVQGGDVAGEQLIVVVLRGFADSHRA
jgi:hypothetical protein